MTVQKLYSLKCDHCGFLTNATSGKLAEIYQKMVSYTPDSPTWAIGKKGEDVCWYCINNGTPWIHYQTGETMTGPFGRNP
jgi:hypothetical protein